MTITAADRLWAFLVPVASAALSLPLFAILISGHQAVEWVPAMALYAVFVAMPAGIIAALRTRWVLLGCSMLLTLFVAWVSWAVMSIIADDAQAALGLALPVVFGIPAALGVVVLDVLVPELFATARRWRARSGQRNFGS